MGHSLRRKGKESLAKCMKDLAVVGCPAAAEAAADSAADQGEHVVAADRGAEDAADGNKDYLLFK